MFIGVFYSNPISFVKIEFFRSPTS